MPQIAPTAEKMARFAPPLFSAYVLIELASLIAPVGTALVTFTVSTGPFTDPAANILVVRV